jgi:hypothetical protein
MKSSYLALFDSDHFVTTFSLAIVWISLSFTYYGLAIMLPSITTKVKNIYPDISEFTVLFFAFFSEIPSNLLAAYLIEKKTFGRKYLLLGSYFFSAIFAFLSYVGPESSIFIFVAFV